MNEIINKVAQSGLVTIDLEELYLPGDRYLFDIKPLLFQELILKEKEFREYLKNEQWEKYTNSYVAITCSNDAIIPTWAYMLISLHLQPYAKKIVFGTLETLELVLFEEVLSVLNYTQYQDTRVVIKGCGTKPIPVNAYVRLSEKLQPYAKSIMYGEPCSTVPLYKKKKDV